MHIRNFLSVAVCIGSIIFSGCFERREEITINEKGNTFIHTLFGGDAEEAPQASELPNKGPWKINKWETTTDKEGKTELDIDAEMNIPYGETLPDRYNLDNKNEEGLRFPSAVKSYRKGDRTFYEFTRRYQPRKYNRYEVFYEQVDKNLEEKIFEKGIFNAPLQEQVQYLNQLVPAFRLSQLRYIYDVLGLMVFNGDISQDLRKNIIDSARERIGADFTPERFKEILARVDEKTIAGEMDRMAKEVDRIFTSVFREHVQADESGLLHTFTELLDKERRARTVTDNIYGQSFEIALKMPGQIIVSNGIFDGEALGTVSWQFSGSDLNDREYVLHAVSVADN